MRSILVLNALLACISGTLCAQQQLPMPSPQPVVQPSAEIPPPYSPPVAVAQPYDQLFSQQPPVPAPVLEQAVCAPEWCESPYRNSAWRLELDLVPTVPRVSDVAFGDWDDDGSLALRLNLGFEDVDGIGMRLLLWGIDHDMDIPVSDVELQASTLYFDFYKRFFVENTELVLGAGPSAARLEYDIAALSEQATFKGSGLTVFGEAFYPLARYRKTDIGSVARARVAILSGQWDDDGTPFVGDTNNDMMTIMELGWGFELRRRFGKHEDKYWHIDFVPEIQRWDSSSLSDLADPGFDGTSINFGLAW
jgi:hypothetical protein